jgi:hypothetical protein
MLFGGEAGSKACLHEHVLFLKPPLGREEAHRVAEVSANLVELSEGGVASLLEAAFEILSLGGREGCSLGWCLGGEGTTLSPLLFLGRVDESDARGLVRCVAIILRQVDEGLSNTLLGINGDVWTAVGALHPLVEKPFEHVALGPFEDPRIRYGGGTHDLYEVLEDILGWRRVVAVARLQIDELFVVEHVGGKRYRGQKPQKLNCHTLVF